MIWLDGRIDRIYLNGHYHNAVYLGTVHVWDGLRKKRGKTDVQVGLYKSAEGVAAVWMATGTALDVKQTVTVRGTAYPVVIPLAAPAVAVQPDVTGDYDELADVVVQPETAVGVSGVGDLMDYTGGVATERVEIGQQSDGEALTYERGEDDMDVELTQVEPGGTPVVYEPDEQSTDVKLTQVKPDGTPVTYEPDRQKTRLTLGQKTIGEDANFEAGIAPRLIKLIQLLPTGEAFIGERKNMCILTGLESDATGDDADYVGSGGAAGVALTKSGDGEPYDLLESRSEGNVANVEAGGDGTHYNLTGGRHAGSAGNFDTEGHGTTQNWANGETEHGDNIAVTPAAEKTGLPAGVAHVVFPEIVAAEGSALECPAGSAHMGNTVTMAPEGAKWSYPTYHQSVLSDEAYVIFDWLYSGQIAEGYNGTNVLEVT